MTIAETLLLDFDQEMSGVRRTLERIPDAASTSAWRPHEKSMAMGRLAAHVALLPKLVPLIVNRDELRAPGPDWPPNLDFVSSAKLLEDFDRCSAEARAALAAASDDQLTRTWKFYWADQLVVQAIRVGACRSVFFNHLIHHRAQLGVYLRLNELPVPGLYGPSADEMFTPTK